MQSDKQSSNWSPTTAQRRQRVSELPGPPDTAFSSSGRLRRTLSVRTFGCTLREATELTTSFTTCSTTHLHGYGENTPGARRSIQTLIDAADLI